MLIHNSHTGRYFQSRHTSYSALVFMALLAGVLLLTATTTALAGQNESGSVGLSGVWPGLPPSAAPQILDPVNGQILSAALTLVRGSCQGGLVVEVLKNGEPAGAAVCRSDGSFSLQIDLLSGRNDLLAKQHNAFNQVSPDSNLVTVWFNFVAPKKPTTPSRLNPNKTQVSLYPVIDQLVIKPDKIYQAAEVNEGLEWSVQILGGSAPYAAVFDWGDGQSSLISLAAADKLTGQHRYGSPGNYKVTIMVSDNGGQSAYLQTVGLVRGKPTVSAPVKPADGGALLVAWPLYIWLIFVLASFWLGERLEKHKLNSDFRHLI